MGRNSVVKIHTIERSETQSRIIMKKYDQDLFQYIQTHSLKEKRIKQIFKKVCVAVRDLHRMKIAHLDLKPENILLKFHTPVITDFGSSIIWKSSIDKTFRSGTTNYQPPETRSPSDEPLDPFRVDVYSLGVLLHVSLTGYFPFNGHRQLDLSYAATQVSSKAFDLIRVMVDPNPLTRPTIDEVLNHPWFRARFF